MYQVVYNNEIIFKGSLNDAQDVVSDLSNAFIL